jgi:hypothetical protein
MIEASSAWMAMSIWRGGRNVPWSAVCFSDLKNQGPARICPLREKETVLGPASLEERGDRRKPRCALSLAHYLPDCKSQASTIMNGEPLFNV